MRLHILGCGNAFGSGGRNQSGYLIAAADRVFLIDCGPTTLLAMKRAGLDPQRLDAVFLSHLHGDHYAGLPFLFIEFLYNNPRERPLEIAGPPGTKEKVQQLFRLMYGSGTEMQDLPFARFSVLKPGVDSTIAGVRVFPFRVPHQVREISLGLRISYGERRILFSGDSAWTDEFVTHARGADLFLCECSNYDQETSNHMSYKILSEHMQRLQCKNLVLTHLGDEMLGRRQEISTPMAEDGMVIEF